MVVLCCDVHVCAGAAFEAASAAWLMCELAGRSFVVRVQMVECAALLPVACICLRPAVMGGRHTHAHHP